MPTTMSVSLSRLDSDSYYVQDCRQIQNNTHAIQTAAGQISRLVSRTETDEDFQHCQQMVDKAVRQASETKQMLTRLKEHSRSAGTIAESNNRRMMYHKLSDNLSITARVLEDVVKRFTTKERERMARRAESGMRDLEAEGDCELSARGAAGVGQAQEVDVQVLEKDKMATLKRVDEDVRCLQEIYNDLANHCEDQEAILDTLESHMADANQDVKSATEQIESSKYAYDRRWKRRMYMGMGSAVGVFFLLSTLWGS